jgi:hypothetical protein
VTIQRASVMIVAGLALSGATCGEVGDVKPPPGRSTDQPRPRDGDVAIQEELEAARRQRTVAAYDLFIARHPDHPLAAAARKERAELTR